MWLIGLSSAHTAPFILSSKSWVPVNVWVREKECRRGGEGGICMSPGIYLLLTAKSLRPNTCRLWWGKEEATCNGWRGDQWSVMEASRCSPLELLHTEMISVGCACLCGGSLSWWRAFKLEETEAKGISFGVNLHILWAESSELDRWQGTGAKWDGGGWREGADSITDPCCSRGSRTLLIHMFWKVTSWPFPFIRTFGHRAIVQTRSFKTIHPCSSLVNTTPLKLFFREGIKYIPSKDQLPENLILNEQCEESKLLCVLEPGRVGLSVHTWSTITLRLCKQIDFLCCSLPLCQLHEKI